MIRRLKPSPAMVVALLALFVSLGGVSYAATKIGTRQIKNGAVTAKKLHKNAVTTKKIHNGAVNGAKIADRSINYRDTDGSIVNTFTAGVAVAGVNLSSNGILRRYFNRFGGAPTVSHPSTGLYQISFPGSVGHIRANNSIALATLIGQNGEIRVTSFGKNAAQVRTANSNGVPANRAFNYMLMLRSP